MPVYNIEPPRKHRIFLYIFVGAASFLLGWQVPTSGIFGDFFDKGNQSEIPKLVNAKKDEKADLSLYWKVWQELEGKYVDHDVVEDEKLIYGSIKGMVKSLDDPYTEFMTPDETKQFTEGLEGTLEGIGAELTVEEKSLIILSPIKGSPAEKAGLKSGDIIYMIDGAMATDMTIVEAITKIRGEKGTTVTLTIIRDKFKEPFDVSIVRDSIDIENVTVEKLDGDIVYLGVNYFNNRTNEEFGKAISELILNEPKGLIIDFRFNGGGYLDIAVELLSYILPSKTPVVIIKERGKEDEVKYTNGNPKLLNVPLVVLVNDSSASASEIVAGAIQDTKRGIIMGTKSYGKGSVQEVESFSDGSSLRITIAKWFTPNNRSIDKIGLDPDIFVEIKDSDIEKKFDRQKEEARKYLENL